MQIRFSGFLTRLLILLTVSLAFTQVMHAQPGEVRRDALSVKVDDIFAQFAKPGSPGCALGVYRDGSLLYSRGYGESDLERAVRITPATVFLIGSTTKQFTAMSIWLLARQNKLSPDDDVRKYIPELPVYGSPITIRHLLYHTSGLRDYTDLLELAGYRVEDVTTNADILDLTLRQKRLNFPTGTAHQYTNTNYILLAEIVRRVSGQTLREFAKANIFDPLGMKSTRYVDDHTLVIPNRAMAYTAKGEGKYAISMSNTERIGPGGLYTTVEDLACWDRNFYTHEVGGREVLESMLKPGSLSNGKTLDYASGLMLGTYKGVPTVRHTGSLAGYRADFLRLPTLKFSVATLCNVPSTPRPERLAEQVADVYLSDYLAKAESTATPAATPTQRSTAVTKEQMAGALRDYWNPRTGEVRQLVLRNEQPVYVIDSWSRARLTAFSPTQFRFGRNEINVTSSPQGKRLLTLRWSDGRVETYEELRRAKLTAVQLARYKGSFYSAELDAGYLIESKEGGLSIKRKNQEDRQLLPTVADSFSEGSIRIRFLRDGRGRTSSFLFSEGDVSDIRFELDCRRDGKK